jgi:hypothetical protein
MAEHEHGSMDISNHQKVFDGFMKWVTRSVVVIFILLILLAMWNG